MTHARARKSDPLTSHEAAFKSEEGKAESQRRRCLEYVRKYPGKTAAEIAAGTGLERHVPSRRLPELRDAGLIENREARPCAIVGSKSMTWAVVPKDSQRDLFA